jgi:hypothetical protein
VKAVVGVESVLLKFESKLYNITEMKYELMNNKEKKRKKARVVVAVE